MAAVKVKLATGTLTLQEHKAKFARKGEVSFLCPMCEKESENTAHFILQCASLQEVRKPFMDKVLSYLETNGESDTLCHRPTGGSKYATATN
jgi:hypothetical protein